jgi:hypothetical protein
MVTDAPPRHSDVGTYTIDGIRRIAVITYHRQPSFPEWRDLMSRVITDPRFKPGMAVVSDRRALSETHTPEAVRQMASYLTRFPAVRGCAWAVVSDPRFLAELGMTNVGQVLFDYGLSITVQRFTDLDAALDWATGNAR